MREGLPGDESLGDRDKRILHGQRALGDLEGDVVVLGPGEDVGVRMGGDVDTEEDTATSFSMDGRGTSGPAFDCGCVEF